MSRDALAVPFPVSGVLFDLDNTLFDRDVAFRKWAAAFVRARLTLTNEGERVAALARLIALDDRGYGAKPAMFAALKAAYPALRPSVEDLVATFYAQMRDYGTLDAGAARLLAALRRAGIPFGIVTNGTEHQMHKVRALGLDALTSCIFVSALCGCRKPGAPIFLAAATHLDVDPAHVLFVGDNPEVDMWGARNAGMRTAWLRRGQSWPAHVPASCVDLAIDALDDVLAMARSRDEEA